MSEILELHNMVKIFPPNVVALDDVSVDFREGEIHALIGENGAGKSTLMKILYGIQPADSGEIFLHGKPVNFNNPGEAIQAKIGMVHQEILLIAEYTVWENVILGNEPTGLFNRINRKKAREKVISRINEFNFNLDPDEKVENLSIAARQKVEILKLLYRDVSFLILDEPTAVLTPQEIPQLFDELRRLRASGHTIIYISHHLDEVLELSDRITVLRKGKKVNTIETETATKDMLAQMMVGRQVIFQSLREPHETGEIVFDLQSVSFKDKNKRQALENVSIQVRTGEIAGIAGVEGNGQYELVRVIMGLLKPDQGKLLINGKDLTRASILERRKHLAFVSQDRGHMGACLPAAIEENAMMTHHRLNPAFSNASGLVLNMQQAKKFTREIQSTFDVQMDSISAEFRSLSGGNQQKVILGRELLLQAPFLLLDQPTRGLDVGSIEYVHRHILKMRRENRAILMISADLEELFRISDRILVLHRGKIVANLATEKTNIDEVGYLMLEGAPHAA